ncbi:NAD-dependent epimerase/dehydratase family protein [Geodermatophilus sp. SYSU D00691]
MRCVVTGVAGFIGSHLSQRLVGSGHEVLGIDCLTDYYDVRRKHANLEAVRASGVRTATADLRDADIDDLLAGADVVFHLAGQPGVRASWGDSFADYLSLNVAATQRLLEAARRAQLHRFVYASSSSVYGEAAGYPTVESAPPAPVSPYGVTKLAGEHLGMTYLHNWAVPVVALRYFTVYGPRQRPDMGIHRFLQALLHDRAITVWGDGEQLRDFTFVGDVVTATVAAGTGTAPPGSVINVAGGSAVSVNQVIALLEEVTGRRARVEHVATQAGDVTATGGSIERAARLLGWAPVTTLAQGLKEQWAWQQDAQ